MNWAILSEGKRCRAVICQSSVNGRLAFPAGWPLSICPGQGTHRTGGNGVVPHVKWGPLPLILAMAAGELYKASFNLIHIWGFLQNETKRKSGTDKMGVRRRRVAVSSRWILAGVHVTGDWRRFQLNSSSTKRKTQIPSREKKKKSRYTQLALPAEDRTQCASASGRSLRAARVSHDSSVRYAARDGPVALCNCSRCRFYGESDPRNRPGPNRAGARTPLLSASNVHQGIKLRACVMRGFPSEAVSISEFRHLGTWTADARSAFQSPSAQGHGHHSACHSSVLRPCMCLCYPWY